MSACQFPDCDADDRADEFEGRRALFCSDEHMERADDVASLRREAEEEAEFERGMERRAEQQARRSTLGPGL